MIFWAALTTVLLTNINQTKLGEYKMDNIQTVKELRNIAAAMASGDRSNQALGAVYDSIMQLSYKLQDADLK